MNDKEFYQIISTMEYNPNGTISFPGLKSGLLFDVYVRLINDIRTSNIRTIKPIGWIYRGVDNSVTSVAGAGVDYIGSILTVNKGLQKLLLYDTFDWSSIDIELNKEYIDFSEAEKTQLAAAKIDVPGCTHVTQPHDTYFTAEFPSELLNYRTEGEIGGVNRPDNWPAGDLIWRVNNNGPATMIDANNEDEFNAYYDRISLPLACRKDLTVLTSIPYVAHGGSRYMNWTLFFIKSKGDPFGSASKKHNVSGKFSYKDAQKYFEKSDVIPIDQCFSLSPYLSIVYPNEGDTVLKVISDKDFQEDKLIRIIKDNAKEELQS